MKTKKSENVNINFEEQFKKLEEIAEMLDNGEAPFDEQLKSFEEGISLIKELREYLDKAELKVIDISKSINNSDDQEKLQDDEIDLQ